MTDSMNMWIWDTKLQAPEGVDVCTSFLMKDMNSFDAPMMVMIMMMMSIMMMNTFFDDNSCDYYNIENHKDDGGD